MTDDMVIPIYTPKLHDIHRYFDNYVERGRYCPIVGNEKSRMTIALAFPLMKIPIMIRGPAGSGKSTIIKSAVSLAWGPEVIDDKVPSVLYVAGSSEKGLLTNTMVSRISNVCTHCVVPELQNALKDERMEAIIKLWAEGESYSYKRASDFGKITTDISLQPLPILTSIANENKYSMKLGEEIERRFYPLYTVSNTPLNKKVHMTKAESWMTTNDNLIKMTEEEKTRLRVHMTKAAKLTHIVRNPSAMFMSQYMPAQYVISNSMVGYWYNLVAAVTKFHFNQRIEVVADGKKYLLSSPEDNWIGWKIGGESIVMGCNGIPDLGVEIIDILPMRDEFSPDARITLNQVLDMLRMRGIERNKNQIKATMQILELSNYAKTDEHDKDTYYKTEMYSLDSQVDWKTCVKDTVKVVRENFPDIAEEYIDRFCTEPAVTDPFTNELLSLLDIPFEPVLGVTKKAGKDEKKVKLSEYF